MNIPENADHEVILHRIAHRQLSVQLTLAVDIQLRIVLAVRRPWGFSLTVEHIVGGQIQQLAAAGFAGICDVLGAAHIDPAYHFFFLFVFCRIHGSLPSAKDYRGGFDFGDGPADRLGIGDVQLAPL